MYVSVFRRAHAGNILMRRCAQDANEDDIKDINPSQMHGHVDAPYVDSSKPTSTRLTPTAVSPSILKAGADGYINGYIVCPSGVVGASPVGVPVKNGTILLKGLSQGFIEKKEAFYVGEGSNEYQFVHIEDLVDYFMIVIDIAVSGKDAGASAYSRYYIATTGVVTWKEIAEIAGERLHKRGIIAKPTARSVPVSYLQPYVPCVFLSLLTTHADSTVTVGWPS